jgi:isoleucyl-tRNA synthetase
MDDDKIAAYTTLYTVLVTMAKISAPFTPFMAESIYQNLVPNFYKDAPKSVHLCPFPQVDASAIDKKLEEGMQNVLDIVVLGRACRNTSNIKNRQPLSKIFVCSERTTELTEGLLNIAKDELNVKDVEYLSDASRFVSYKLKPQLKTLGPKYGKNLGKIKQFLDTCDANKVVATVKAGEVYKTEIDGDTFEFALEDLQIFTESAEGFVSSSDKGLTIVLDTKVTEELKAEGNERELISKIQSMRKDAGFEVTDRITVNYVCDSQAIKNAMASQTLKSVVLANAVVEGQAQGFAKDLDVNGETCTVIINKVNA